MTATATKPTTFALGSSPAVSAPGILKWAMNGYHFKRDRKNLVNVMKSGWDGLTDEQWHGVLSGKIAHVIEDETVLITVPVPV